MAAVLMLLLRRRRDPESGESTHLMQGLSSEVDLKRLDSSLGIACE